MHHGTAAWCNARDLRLGRQEARLLEVEHDRLPRGRQAAQAKVQAGNVHWNQVRHATMKLWRFPLGQQMGYVLGRGRHDDFRSFDASTVLEDNARGVARFDVDFGGGGGLKDVDARGERRPTQAVDQALPATVDVVDGVLERLLEAVDE